MDGEHCDHCVNHEFRLKTVEDDRLIQRAAVSFLRWFTPIVLSGIGIAVVVVIK